MDISKPKALLVVQAILSSYSFTQYGLWKKTGVSFGQVNKVVRYLEEKRVVGRSGGKYQIRSLPGILQLFTAFRTFPKPAAVFQVTGEAQPILSFLAEEGCVFCLTTAWQHYDDYLRDGAIHAYLPSSDSASKRIIAQLSTLAKGNRMVFLYPQDLPVKPVKVRNTVFKVGDSVGGAFNDFKPLKQLPATTEVRTLLDIYTSHYAYGTDNWIKRKGEEWAQE